MLKFLASTILISLVSADDLPLVTWPDGDEPSPGNTYAGYLDTTQEGIPGGKLYYMLAESPEDK
jgi:hypothetical protein